MAEFFAVLSSTLYAATQILIKRGTAKGTSVVAGLLVSLVSGSLAMILAYALLADEPLRSGAIVPFVVAGMFGAAFGRILTIISVDRLGPSISVPLQGSVYPLSAVAIGVVFLNEEVTVTQLCGIGILLTGIWLLSRIGPGRTQSHSSSLTSSTQRRSFLRPGVIFPLLAGLCYSGADFFRKSGIEIVPDPIIGTTIGVVSSFVFWTLAAAVLKPLRAEITFGAGIKFFALAGLTSSAAVLSVINALETGDVSTISPIVASQPLPTMILSGLFLRGIDRITRTIVIGALLVVGGIVLISA
jgi:drug/metabolite transporter, DME family